jgi:putative ABC transport system substrate-binding protein
MAVRIPWWPVIAHAQASVRRVGVVLGWDENYLVAKNFLSRLRQRLGELGWREGHNLRFEIRYTAGNVERARAVAKELVGQGLDVLLATTTPVTAALHWETRTLPIVFTHVTDPIGPGFVTTLSHPGGNITGFINIEATMGGKWLELLKETAPEVKHWVILAIGTPYRKDNCDDRF